MSLSPLDLGLPPKFSQWRLGQWDAIERTSSLFERYRYVIQSAPTGFGKSPYYVASSILEGGRSVILTSTKALQDQLNRDFSSCGMFDIRGRQNYSCLHYHNCSDGRLYGCDEKDACPAARARRQFLDSRLSDTNYAYYLSSNIHGEGCGPINLLILDEAHAAVQELSDAIEIHLPHRTYEILYRHFSSYPQRNLWDLPGYVAWAKGLGPEVGKYKELIKDSSDSKLKGLVNHFLLLLTKIAGTPPEWILDERVEETVIAPLWPTDQAQRYLFPPSVNRVLLTSATIVPKTKELLDIPEEESIFLAEDHVFDPRRSPFYLFGPHRVSYKDTADEQAIWLGRFDTLIGRRLDRKGIVHTISYDKQQFIISQSEYSRYMIAPRSSKELPEALERFRNAPPPALLVTPSVTTGYDFPYGDAEYQIICKVPFIDKRGTIMSARDKADPEYLAYLTAQMIVQICGRGMRAPDDRCENFIMDAHANWFVSPKRTSGRNKGGFRHLFPDWFVRQIVKPDGFPPPPMTLEEERILAA